MRCTNKPTCGESPADAKFCIDCGAAFAPAETGPTTKLPDLHQQPLPPPVSPPWRSTLSSGTPVRLPVPVVQTTSVNWIAMLSLLMIGFMVSLALSASVEAGFVKPGVSFAVSMAVAWFYSNILGVRPRIPAFLGGSWGVIGWMFHMLLLTAMS